MRIDYDIIFYDIFFVARCVCNFFMLLNIILRNGYYAY